MKGMVLLLVLLLTAGCDDSRRGNETRTYELSRLNMDEAISLITPYVREGGMVSGRNKLLTVRERPDRLTLIEDMLRKYDGVGEAFDVILDIQVIEANGFTDKDPRIADVQSILEQTFKYRGYKLIGETRVQAREDGVFRHGTSEFSMNGRVDRIRTTGKSQRLPVHIEVEVRGKADLGSTITTEIGKPVVLGQSTATGAIILVVRSSIAGT